MTNIVNVQEVEDEELDFADTLGRHPSESADLAIRKRPAVRADPLEVLIGEAIAMRNAKVLRMDFLKKMMRNLMMFRTGYNHYGQLSGGMTAVWSSIQMKWALDGRIT